MKVDWTKTLYCVASGNAKGARVQYMGVVNGKHLCLMGKDNLPHFLDENGCGTYNEKECRVIANESWDDLQKKVAAAAAAAASSTGNAAPSQALTQLDTSLCVVADELHQLRQALDNLPGLIASAVAEALGKPDGRASAPDDMPPAPMHRPAVGQAAGAPRSRPMAIVHSFAALPNAGKAEKALEKIDGGLLRSVVERVMAHPGVRSVSVGTQNLARKKHAIVGSIHVIQEIPEHQLLKARGVDDEAIADLFIYYHRERKRDVLDFLAAMPRGIKA